MKTNFLNLKSAAAVLLIALGATSCQKDKGTPAQNSSTQTTVPRAATYQLIWSDDFKGQNLDTSKWSIAIGNPNVNGEEESYQKSAVNASNDFLSLSASKVSSNGQPYTSGKITTAGKFTLQYGRVEARIKIPLVQGMAPAFSLQGANFNTVGMPKCGEIDIMQHANLNNTILGTLNWDNEGFAVYRGSVDNISVSSYHVYAVEWDTKQIRWYVDDNLYMAADIENGVNGTDEFQKPFYINLNLAVGGNLAGNNISTALPTSMVVDYVKVYKQTGTTTNAPIGKTVTFKNTLNKFISSESGFLPITCNRPAAAAWEDFKIVDAGGGKIALQSEGKYVSSENGGPMTCNRTSIGDWEKFDWVNLPSGQVAIRANNIKYITTTSDGNSVSSTATTPDIFSSFTVSDL